jgi:hypothetical protein
MKPHLHDGRIEPPGENPEGTALREQSSLKVSGGRLLLAVPRIVIALILALMTAAAAA